MIKTIDKPNLLLLNRSCELYYSDDKSFAAFGKVAAKNLAERLLDLGVSQIRVEFRVAGDEKQSAVQLKAMVSRMNALYPFFVFSGFQVKVINGYEQNAMIGTLNKCVS